VQDRRPLGKDARQLGVGPLPVGGAEDVEPVVGGAVRVQPDDGEADRLLGRDEPAAVHPGELGVPAQVRAQGAGAQAGEQADRGAEPTCGDRDVERVAAGSCDELRRRALGAGPGRGDGEHVDDQLAEHTELGVAAGPCIAAAHGRTLAADVGVPPALAPGGGHLGRWGATCIARPAFAPEQEDQCPIPS
jgi:hypothetical protein